MNILTTRVLAVAATLAVPVASRAQTTNPLASNSIAALTVAVDGRALGKVTNIKGVSAELDSLIQKRSPGAATSNVDVTLKSPLNNGLKAWRDAVTNNVAGSRQKTLTITATNTQGATLVRWTLSDAWPTKLAVVQRTSDTIVEKIEFTFASIARTQ